MSRQRLTIGTLAEISISSAPADASSRVQRSWLTHSPSAASSRSASR